MFKKILAYAILLTGIISCNQQVKDKGIKQIIAVTAKEEIAFVDVNYAVANGVVTLTGRCATEKERSKVESSVKQTAGVKEVVNKIEVAPIVLNGDHLLKQAADSVLMAYPTAEATVQDSIIYLRGQVKNKDADKITQALTTLGAKNIINQLLVARR